MKIKPIRKDILLCFGIGAAAMTFATGIYSIAKKGVDEDVEYLKQNAPAKYEYLKTKYGIEPFKGSADAWATVAQMHRDSVANAQKIKTEEELRVDSMAQTNYVKGIQAVRDSLNTAGQSH